MKVVPPGRTPEDQVRVAFGRMLGLVLAAIILALGGGLLFLLVAAAVARFMYGG